MYAPEYDDSKRGIVTDSRQLRIDFFSPSNDPINTDSALHYTRPRQHYDTLPRPNFLIGWIQGLLPQMDVYAKSPNAKMPYGLMSTTPDTALPMPQSEFSINGLKKVG